MNKNKTAVKILTAIIASTLSISVCAAKGGGGGTTTTTTTLYVVPTLPTPGYTPTQAAAIHGFDHTGLLQSATVSTTNAACPGESDPTRWGGTAVINNIKITIPCNMIIQMPANTFKWADMVNATTVSGGPSLASYELSVVGNIVNGQYIAGLMHISQESLNGGSGVIQAIDYTTGNLKVNTGDPANPAIVQLNDPNGRFGRVQSPDPRFSVDDANPSVHAGTGYPMCVPRTLTDPNVAGNPDDPLCPKKNRPIATSTAPCRLFGQTGIILPASGELTPTPAGSFCTQYVMKSLTDKTRVATDPTPDQQAPFEVGDFITFRNTSKRCKWEQLYFCTFSRS